MPSAARAGAGGGQSALPGASPGPIARWCLEADPDQTLAVTLGLSCCRCAPNHRAGCNQRHQATAVPALVAWRVWQWVAKVGEGVSSGSHRQLRRACAAARQGCCTGGCCSCGCVCGLLLRPFWPERPDPSDSNAERACNVRLQRRIAAVMTAAPGGSGDASGTSICKLDNTPHVRALLIRTE